ncbi:hypothetical protein AAG570_006912 [Ranatra chinensis]|uniref:Uncharacterized protein n=1 Tax=Ranatra chinensis TaxID=642074 RepID=A0ABD0YVE8_9HEMI
MRIMRNKEQERTDYASNLLQSSLHVRRQTRLWSSTLLERAQHKSALRTAFQRISKHYQPAAEFNLEIIVLTLLTQALSIHSSSGQRFCRIDLRLRLSETAGCLVGAEYMLVEGLKSTAVEHSYTRHKLSERTGRGAGSGVGPEAGGAGRQRRAHDRRASITGGAGEGQRRAPAAGPSTTEAAPAPPPQPDTPHPTTTGLFYPVMV